MPYCPECGTQTNERDKFCENCGHQLSPKNIEEKENQKPEDQQQYQQAPEPHSHGQQQTPQKEQVPPPKSSQPQQGQYREPPARVESKKPFYKKAPFIGLIVALLIGATIAGAYFIFFMEDTEDDFRDSPESTFEVFVERLNENDGEGALELTERPILDEGLSFDWEKLEEEINNGNESITDYEIKEVKYIDDMDSENRSQMEDLINFIEENSTAEVENSCLIKVDINAPEESEIAVPMFEIEGDWYVGIVGLAYILIGQIGGDPGGGEVVALTGSITHLDGTEFEVVAITPNPNYYEVEITVFNGSSTQEWNGYLGTNYWHFLDDDDNVQGDSRFDVSGIGVTTDDMEYVDEVVIQVDGAEGTISYEM